MPSSLFWNQPPNRDEPRSVDPLGFDTLSEAMADQLVPLLSGATRDADEYLWTLIGLRWAQEETRSAVDATIFNQGFAIFERALKQYWYRSLGRRSAGINVVKEICGEGQPDAKRKILINQRATGLLGSYIVSLRGMNLVQSNSLRVVEESVDTLLAGIRFSPPRGWLSSWDGLEGAFCCIELRGARRRLGKQLFEKTRPEMNRAARSVRSRPDAESWARLGRTALDGEQSRLAKATEAVVRFEAAALDAFSCMLRGERILGRSAENALRSRAAAARDANPFPSGWNGSNRIGSAIGDALSSLAAGDASAGALLRLHLRVTRDARHNEPWLQHLGDMPNGFARWRPWSGLRDFRFGNLRTLVRQTEWRPRES